MQLSRDLAIEIQRQKNLAARQRRESLVFYLLTGAVVVGYFIYRMTSLETEKEFFYLLGMLFLARLVLPFAVAGSFALRPGGLASCPVCHHPWGLESVWSEPVEAMRACDKCHLKVDNASLQAVLRGSEGSP